MYPHAVPVYGAKVQYMKEAVKSPPQTKEEKKSVQQVIRTFLFYGRAVDGTILTLLSPVVSEQVTPMQEIMRKTKKFLNYAATHLDTIVTYIASNLMLVVHSDAFYLSKPQAGSQARGHFFMSSDCGIPLVMELY